LGDLLTLDKSLAAVLSLPRGWHAHRQQLSAGWERSPIPSGPTHLLQCEAIPAPENPEAAFLAGAFVNCWIRCRRMLDAKRSAETEIAEAQWRRVTTLEHHVMRQAEVRKVDKKYFDQAQIDGCVLVIYTYPAKG
jgi:hypothetical protein